MRLFGFGGSAEDAAARERREASVTSLERGGLPLNAVDRLREQSGKQNTPEHLFTSNLSVGEALLTRAAGYVPLGQVMGSTVYHIGWQWTPSYSGMSGELETLTQAFYAARHRALGRLQQEAALLGATGVVGVRLERTTCEWGASLLEFAAMGTAIRENDLDPAAGKDAKPFLSDLSGDQFWLLRQGGYRPIGIAIGNTSFYQVAGWNTQQITQGGFLGGSWQNVEITEFTQSLYDARSIAMGRMEADARAVDAEGIVGVTVDIEAKPHEIGSDNSKRIVMLYHITGIGTAIAPCRPALRVDDVKIVVPLR